jgi:dCMP deaminase
MFSEKWDKRFLEAAKLISEWSLDPSTKVGAVIVDQDKRIVSLGYNGLPQGIHDSSEILENRELKYCSIIHAELNAVLFSNRDLAGMSLYVWPIQPCARCTSVIIQKKIKRVIIPASHFGVSDRWKVEFDFARELLDQAHVSLERVECD